MRRNMRNVAHLWSCTSCNIYTARVRLRLAFSRPSMAGPPATPRAGGRRAGSGGKRSRPPVLRIGNKDKFASVLPLLPRRVVRRRALVSYPAGHTR